MPEFTPGYAVLVGVGDDLPVTVKDAVGLADILCDPARCAFPASQVQTLTESKATRSGVLSALDGLVKDVGVEDTVIVYFSGHGYQVALPEQPESFRLLTHGYDLDDLPNTTIGRAKIGPKHWEGGKTLETC